MFCECHGLVKMLKPDLDYIKCCWNKKFLSFAMKIKELFNEIIIWDILTTFQKLVCVFVFLAFISYLTSAWSVILVMILGVPLAFLTSEKMHQRNVPFASDFLLTIVIIVQYVKIIFLSVQNLVKGSFQGEETQVTNHLTSAEDTRDENVQNSESAVVKAEKILVDLVIRDFIHSWFVSFSNSSQFLEESRSILISAASNCHHRVSTLKAENLTVSLINLYRQHLQCFQKSKHFYECRKTKLSILSVKEKSIMKPVVSLEEAFGMNCDYHPALSTDVSEEKYLRSLAKASLALILPDDVLMCESSQIIFVEIITYKILKHVISLMSDSNWIHDHMIILFSESHEQSPDGEKSDDELMTNKDISCSSFESKTNLCVSSDDTTSKSTSTLSRLDENVGQCNLDNIPKVTFDIFEEPCNTPDDSKPNALNSNDELAASLQLVSSEDNQQRSNSETSLSEQAESSSVDLERTCSSANDLKSSSVKEFSFSNVFSHNDKDNFIENISRKCKTTFQSLTKFDSSSQNNSPKINILSTDVPSFNVCDDVNEITVPRQRNVHKQRGDQMTGVECPDEALPTKGNEIIKLTMSDVDTEMYENIAEQKTDTSLIKDESLIYQDIDITRTEEFQEFRSNSKYTMYAIEYIALYFSDGGHPVLRSGLVKRRFREFVNLQSRLDDQPKYRTLLRDVKGPSRWATLPFKNRDKDSVESRRAFLDKFLKGLILVEAVCNGPELREFLAYEGDTHIAFVRKAPEMTVPRIDKMFVRTVSEVFDRLKAIPDIPHNVISTIIKRDRSVENLDIKKTDDTGHLEIDYICSQMDEVQELERFKQNLEEFNSSAETGNPEQLDEETTDGKDKELSSPEQSDYPALLAQLPRLQGDGSEVPDKAVNEVGGYCDVPLTDAVFGLAVQALQGREHWLCRERVLKSVKVLIGKAVNKWLGEQIDWLSSEERFAYYLALLRESIWPNGQLSSEDSPEVSQEDKLATRNKAKQCLKDFLPGMLPMLAGETDYDYAVEQIMESLEYENINRHFLYTFLDVLVEKIFPEFSTQEMQRIFLS